MALLDFCRPIRPQCDFVLPVSPHIDLAVLLLPGHLVGHATPSSTITLSRYFSDGSRNDSQHDRLRLRPSLGWRGHQACTCSCVIIGLQVDDLTGLGLGIVVD